MEVMLWMTNCGDYAVEYMMWRICCGVHAVERMLWMTHCGWYAVELMLWSVCCGAYAVECNTSRMTRGWNGPSDLQIFVSTACLQLGQSFCCFFGNIFWHAFNTADCVVFDSFLTAWRTRHILGGNKAAACDAYSSHKVCKSATPLGTPPVRTCRFLWHLTWP